MSVVVIVILVAIVVLVRRGRRQSARENLVRGERIRPIAITALDPLISLLIIGDYLLRLIEHSAFHLGLAIAGGAVGICIGYLRAKVMVVRVLPNSSSIVLKRSGVEYFLVAMLVVLRVLENTLDRSHSGVGVDVVCALASLGLIESIARSAFILLRYRRESMQAKITKTSPTA
jgi:hypothetical protein